MSCECWGNGCARGAGSVSGSITHRPQSANGLERLATWVVAPIKLILLAVLWVYQRLVSPALGPCCRFTPSCSTYARECLQQYGLWRALGKTTWRLLRCHPMCRGGYDPP